ncbi:MAG: homocysteine S-methyltransferase [Nocardioides sp.]|nr:homocysteine S-methyltransferase [Nocardioides sp.]
MPTFRDALPQLGDDVFLTDSGLETELLFNQGVDLPQFAAFPLLNDTEGRSRLRTYFADHAALAAQADVGMVLEAPTWRASADWGALLDFDETALDRVNRSAVDLLRDVRAEYGGTRAHPISGCLGPRGDAYQPDELMTSIEAAGYHRAQIETFADTEADLITAMTLTYPTEAEGIAVATRAVGMPVVLSFTVETDGRLPDGTTLAEAVQAVDEATEAYPAYYMVNCAHPSHLDGVLDPDAAWTGRVRGIRANASSRSHAELDEATELDSGDPVAFGREYAALRERLPGLTVLGGCCGTDLRHLQQVASACL